MAPLEMSVCASVSCGGVTAERVLHHVLRRAHAGGLQRLGDVGRVVRDIPRRADRVGQDRRYLAVAGRGERLELLHHGIVGGEPGGRDVGRTACTDGGPAPPYTVPTNIADTTRDILPRIPALLKRTLTPFLLSPPPGSPSWAAVLPLLGPLQLCCSFKNDTGRESPSAGSLLRKLEWCAAGTTTDAPGHPGARSEVPEAATQRQALRTRRRPQIRTARWPDERENAVLPAARGRARARTSPRR